MNQCIHCCVLLFLGDERGPVLEVIVSRTNFISSHTEKTVRVVGLSTALANARDLADWLGIGQVGNIFCKRIMHHAQQLPIEGIIRFFNP